MDEFNTDGLKDTLDLFILNRFIDGPLSVSEVQRRLEPIFTYLALVAARTRRQSSGSLLTALQRLQREGWLKAERLGEQPDPETVYSLTALGEQRIKEEMTRRGSIVSQFIEDAALDKSFREFLKGRGLPYAN